MMTHDDFLHEEQSKILENSSRLIALLALISTPAGLCIAHIKVAGILSR